MAEPRVSDGGGSSERWADEAGGVASPTCFYFLVFVSEAMPAPSFVLKGARGVSPGMATLSVRCAT